MSVTDRVEIIPANVVCQEFNRKFDFIPCDIFIDLGKQPGMNGAGGGLIGYKIVQPLGTDHFFL